MDEKRKYFDEVSGGQAMEDFGDEDIPKLKNLMSLWGLKKGDIVLEAGSGKGRLTPYILEAVGKEGKVYCFDFALQMLLKAKDRGFGENVKLTQADASCIPLVDGCCDVVLCFSAFPHFADKKKALRELLRVLKPSGRLVISHLATREKINAFHSKQRHPIQNDLIPSDEDMEEFLSETGFGLEESIINDDRGYLVKAHSLRQV